MTLLWIVIAYAAGFAAGYGWARPRGTASVKVTYHEGRWDEELVDLLDAQQEQGQKPEGGE